MSWNLYITTKDADNNESYITAVDGHTSNLNPMWYRALPNLNRTSDLEGKKCGDILESVKLGLVDVILHADEYEDLNPENGWGDFEGFKEVFIRFARLCEKHPSGIIGWSG